MTALLQRADRRQHCRVRAIQPPLIPAHTVESAGKIGCTIPLIGTQRADALELAIEQRLVVRQPVMIDLQRIHARKQEASIVRTASPLGYLTARR